MDQWRAGAGLRWMRAAVLAASGVLGGSLFHVAADGGLPGPPGLLAIWVVSTVAVAPLLGAELGPYRVVALLVAWQAGVHAILGVLADRGPGVQAVASTSTATTGGHHATHAALIEAPGAMDVVLATMIGHAPMALGHAAAAALAGLWLAAGERALGSLLALSHQRVCVPAGARLRSWIWLPGDAPLPLRTRAVRETADVPPARLPVRLLAGCLGRRGPPVFC